VHFPKGFASYLSVASIIEHINLVGEFEIEQGYAIKKICFPKEEFN
jgi:hypothetical protein